MIKKLVKYFFRSLGYNISKIRHEKDFISIRTDKLSYHKTVTGNYYLPADAKGDVVANTIINNSIFEPEVVNLALNYIKEDTIVLDIGANFGQMSILFSNRVGKEGKVYAFDADDFIFSILLKNIEGNNKKNNIIPIFGAVHNIEGEKLYFPEQDFVDYPAYGAYGIDYTTNKGREVTSLTIDSLNINDPISFMKIDIQGGDLLAMQGAIKTIEKNKMPILFEYEYHFEEKYNLCFQDYVDFVRSINYKFVKVISGHNYLIMPV